MEEFVLKHKGKWIGPSVLLVVIVVLGASASYFGKVGPFSMGTLAAVSNNQNDIPNGNIEQIASNGSPAGWLRDPYGDNDATFMVETKDCHSGTQCLKVVVSSFNDGNGDWYFNPIPVQGRTVYRFSDWYKATTKSQVVLDYLMLDGTRKFLPLATLPLSSNWQQYETQFTIPDGVESLTILHQIASVGELLTDDYSLQVVKQYGFSRGVVSLVFDDGTESHQNAFSLLQKYQVHGTFYLILSKLGQPGYLSISQAKAIQSAGNEIGSHTVTHPFLTKLSPAEVQYQLTESKKQLEQTFGRPVTDFAFPYGAKSDQVLVQVRSVYSSARNSDRGYNDLSSFDPYNIRVQYVVDGTSVDQVKAWIEYANRHHVWLVLLFHDINAVHDMYGFSPQKFEGVLQYLQQSHIAVEPVRSALNELIPQTK